MPNVGVSPNRGARYAAKVAGLLQYDTGRPCIRGHVAPRYTKTALCTACQREYYGSAEFLRGARTRENARRKANPRKHLWKVAMARAAKRHIEFTISVDDMPAVPAVCPILGIKLTETASGFKNRATSPSLDRLDSSRGYVPGNLQIISWRANVIKSDATHDEIEKLYRWSMTRTNQEGLVS